MGKDMYMPSKPDLKDQSVTVWICKDVYFQHSWKLSTKNSIHCQQIC